MNSRKVREELGWVPQRDFTQGLAETVQWYRDNGGVGRHACAAARIATTTSASTRKRLAKSAAKIRPIVPSRLRVLVPVSSAT